MELYIREYKDIALTEIKTHNLGFFPEKTYEIATPPRTYTSGKEGEQSGPQPPDGLASIGRAVEQVFCETANLNGNFEFQFLSGPPAPPGGQPEYQLPPGFNQGFSLNNGKTSLFQQGAEQNVIFSGIS